MVKLTNQVKSWGFILQSCTPDWENWGAGLKIWIQMFMSCTVLIRVSWQRPDKSESSSLWKWLASCCWADLGARLNTTEVEAEVQRTLVVQLQTRISGEYPTGTKRSGAARSEKQEWTLTFHCQTLSQDWRPARFWRRSWRPDWGRPRRKSRHSRRQMEVN